MGLSCAELIDEVQAVIGRPSASSTEIGDTTWVTRRLNEAQKLIVEAVPLIPSVTFKNTTSLDTTGTVSYSVADITVGDSSTANRICHLTDVWYLDGHESRQLTFVPTDDFDAEHPDPTHSDEHFGKPSQWTRRGNTTVEMYPYCASAYWDKNLRFDGDFYPADFSTDTTEVSDISRADEGLKAYALWQAWQAIGDVVQAERAKKLWSNPNPPPGQEFGWLERFRCEVEEMVAWSGSLYDNEID